MHAHGSGGSHRHAAVLQAQERPLEIYDRFRLDQHRGPFGVEIGDESGFSLQQVSGKDDGGARHLGAVDPNAALAAQHGGTGLGRRERERAQEGQHPTDNIAQGRHTRT